MAKDKPTTEKKKEENLPMRLEDSKFAICRAPESQLSDVIALNLGGKKVSPFKLARIRIPDGKSDFWTVPTLDGTEPAKKLEGILVHKKDMRGWWPDTDPTGKPPSCRSDDAIEGLGCRKVAEHYPNDPTDQYHDCATCKFSQFGSDPKGGKGQWCKEMRAVFIIREETFLPTVIFLPPTSLTAFDDYLLHLATYGMPFNKLVIGFGLKKDKNDKGDEFNVVELTKARKLSDVEYEVIRKYTKEIRPALDKVKIEEDDYVGGSSTRGDKPEMPDYDGGATGMPQQENVGGGQG